MNSDAVEPRQYATKTHHINYGKECIIMLKRKVLSALLTLVLVVSMAVPAFSEPITATDNATLDAMIDQLFDRRAELICLEQYDQLDAIDQQLAQLGVEKLAASEVAQIAAKGKSDAVPYVDVPDSGSVSWYSSRTNYTYDGITYEVQTLTAQPNSNSSNLKVSGSRSLSSTTTWTAGTMNALYVVGTSIAGNIPGASLVMTVLDTVSTFISGVSPTTVISNAEIVYSYAHTTTATFKYVKEAGVSDDYQELTYISTKGTTAVGYMYPTFDYDGGQVQPNVIQGSRTIYSTPSGYNSTYNAVVAYTDIYAQRTAYVTGVKITGIESKTVSSLSLLCPVSPLQVY